MDASQLEELVNQLAERVRQLEDESASVQGPASSIDADLAEFDGTSGKKIKDGSLKHSDVSSAVALKHSNALDHSNSSDHSNALDHANTNDPTADQKAALAGTNGTPSTSNKYVTDSDPRNSDARTPLAHAHDVVLGKLAPTGDVTITPGYGALSVEYYEIASGKFLELGAEAIMEVT